ncbi:MAG TPA: amidase [Anaerolineales bacterium]
MPHVALPTLHGTLDLLRAGRLSAREVWAACAAQIDRLDPRLNAFITRMQPVEAPASEHDPDESESIPALSGIPIAVKDLFDTAGVRTTGGSLFFKDRVPDHDAAAVTALRRAGAQIIGKTNTHEIALGVTTVNPHFGPCRNPWDPDRSPGGSSGGSAVAVASGMALAALGTDTGGSIRIPAALCGIVGLKPTFGRVSLRGVLPLSWNLDHAGPLARTVWDAAMLLQIIAGYDADDPACANSPVDDYLLHLEEGVKGWRVAMIGGSFIEAAEPEVLHSVTNAEGVFRDAGADVEMLELRFLRDAAAANGMMTQADAAAFHRQRLAEHPELFGSDVRRRLESGSATSAADYVLARHTQTDIQRRLAQIFEAFDILMLPSTAVAAPRIDEGDAVERARQLTRFTAPFNLAGLPAISVPCGFTAAGLPIGLQLVAAPWHEAQLLRAARAYEARTAWLERRPTVL